MRDTLRKAKPQCLEDLIALNALYRPGPLRGGVVDDYIARKHGRVEIKYDLPQMEPVLKETYGVIAYQEQVMRLASELAGFTLGQADELRRAMGKKDAAKMQAQRDALHERLPRARHPREEGDEDLRVHRVLRRLRLQQGALDDLRAARVPDGVPQGELPAPLHGGAAHDRVAELRQGRAVPGGVPRARRARPAAGHQRAASWQFVVAARRRAVRAGRRQGRGRGRDSVDPRGPRGARRPDLVPLRAGRAHRSAAREQEGAREPDQGRRVRLARARRPRDLSARGGRACSPASIASSITAAAIRAIAIRGSRGSSAATPRRRHGCDDDAALPAVRGRGRRPRRSASKRKRSAST